MSHDEDLEWMRRVLPEGSVEFVPVALACGHQAKGPVAFHWDLESGKQSQMECPEGCGLQNWIKEPS